MTSATTDSAAQTILDTLRGTRDALSTGRVFGEPTRCGSLTIVPVARVGGTAGGGGGEGEDAGKRGDGFGAGYGLHAQPVGVYAVDGARLTWHPTIDVNRLLNRSVVLAGLVAACLTAIVLRRSPTR